MFASSGNDCQQPFEGGFYCCGRLFDVFTRDLSGRRTTTMLPWMERNHIAASR
jgi:hypothetical protein